MPLFDEKHVKIEGGILVWDELTRPETLDDGGKAWSVKIVVPPNCPDIAILDQLTRNELSTGLFRGQFPGGGHWTFKEVGPNDFGGGFGGWFAIKCKTYRDPQVFDEQGQQLQPMQYGSLVYTGQRIDVLVHCDSYNNVSKGIAARLDGLQIIASAQAPRLNIGGPDMSSAFGAVQPQGGAPQYGAPPAQGGAPQYGAPPAQGGAPQYGAPPVQGGQPQYGQPPAQGGAPTHPPQQAAPAQGAASPQTGASATTYPSNGAPQQAHNYLPGQGQ